MLKEIEECMKLGIAAFDIFPVVAEQHKDAMATRSHDPDFFYLQSLARIKKEFPEACIMTDVAMDPYSSDGHDGILKDGEILNDETLEILGEMALAQAATGIDIVGPSDMMDGRVGYIREQLDQSWLPACVYHVIYSPSMRVLFTARSGMLLILPPNPVKKKRTRWIRQTPGKRC